MRPTILILALVFAFLLSVFVLPELGLDGNGAIFVTVITATLLFGQQRIAIIGGLAGTGFIDLMSASPFGTYLLSLTGTLLLISWLSQTRITNRSFIAFTSLTGIGLTTYLALLYGFGSALHIATPQSLGPQFTSTLVISSLVTLIRCEIIGLAIYFIVRASGRSYATLAEHRF